jgi:hypothetical protein
MKAYTWNEDFGSEWGWNNDEFLTIEECIEDAKKQGITGCIGVGEVEDFEIHVYAGSVLEEQQEYAYDECGEAAENWEINFSELDDLDQKLTRCVKDWLKETNQEPHLKQVIDIRKVEVV